MGIASQSRDKTFAYDALIAAIARNVRLHVNTPNGVPEYGTLGGVSGFRSARYTPEYKGQGTARTFYDGLLGMDGYDCWISFSRGRGDSET